MSKSSGVTKSALAETLRRQLRGAWSLAVLHLEGLTGDEALWQAASSGPRVRLEEGRWTADWPEDESYAAGVPTIAWLEWHIGMWWTLVANRAFRDGTLDRSSVNWPGSADLARAWLFDLHDAWAGAIDHLGDDDLARPATWPLSEGTLGDVIAWANIELMKNASELGLLRFLYASAHA
jgi:hypothetical protein